MGPRPKPMEDRYANYFDKHFAPPLSRWSLSGRYGRYVKLTTVNEWNKCWLWLQSSRRKRWSRLSRQLITTIKDNGGGWNGVEFGVLFLYDPGVAWCCPFQLWCTLWETRFPLFMEVSNFERSGLRGVETKMPWSALICQNDMALYSLLC
jgi:hypothetical protein